MSTASPVINLKRRAVSTAGIVFTGKNGKDVVQFVKDYAGEQNQLKNGGSYVKIATNDGRLLKATKGHYVIVDADGELLVVDDDRFTLFFLVKADQK